MTPELVALLGLLASIIVRVWSNQRSKALEAELDNAHDDLDQSRRRELELERELHCAKRQLARLGVDLEDKEKEHDEGEEEGVLSRR